MNPLIVFLALFSVCSVSDATQFENIPLIESYTSLSGLFKRFSERRIESVYQKQITLIEWVNEVMESIATTLSLEGVYEVESSVEGLKEAEDNLLEYEKNLPDKVLLSSNSFVEIIKKNFDDTLFSDNLKLSKQKVDMYLKTLRSVRKQIGLFQPKQGDKGYLEKTKEAIKKLGNLV